MIKLAILAGALIACSTAQAQPKVLKWAHVFEPTEHYHQQAMSAAAEIGRLSGGRIRVEVVPSSKAGSEEMYSAKLKSGEIDIAYLGISYAAREFPGLAISGFPFVFQDTDHVRRYLASPYFQEQLDGYERITGNRMVTAVYYGARHLTANKFISSPQDLIGLKLRVPGAAAYKLFGQSMQTQVTPVPFSKVYDALKSGEVEAQENPLSTIYAKKFYEVQKFVYLTAHIHDLVTITIAQSSWKGLTPGDQKMIEGAIKKAASWANVQTISNELVMETELRNRGLKIVAVDRKAFREAALKHASPADLGATTADYERMQLLARTPTAGTAVPPSARK
jgi:tripartite ATP-independent transporter DctP family solute receptor